MFAKVPMGIARALLACGLAAGLQSCIESDKPLLSEDRNIVDATLTGTYLFNTGRMIVKQQGRQYTLFGVAKGNKTITVDLQKLDDHFDLVQTKVNAPKSSYQYWIVYMGGKYLLLGDIPCDRHDDSKINIVCDLNSRDDLIAAAQAATKQFLNEPSIITPLIKQP